MRLVPLLLLGLCGPALAGDTVLAVLPFSAHTDSSELSALGPGLADMLTTDLVEADGLVLVERTRLDAVLGELELQASDFVDPETAAEVGQGVGATAVVVGSLTARGDVLRLDARVIDVGTGTVRTSVDREGHPDAFFDLERGLALQILDALEVPVSAAHRTRLLETTVEVKLGGDGTDPDGAVLTIERKGLFSGKVWINGVNYGAPTRKEPVTVRLKPGPHEVVLADNKANELYSWTTIDLPDGGLTVDTKALFRAERGSDAPWDSALRGAMIEVKCLDDVDAMYRVDDGLQSKAMRIGDIYNVAPGTHEIVVTRRPPTEPGEPFLPYATHCHGAVMLADGQTAIVTISNSSCGGM